MPILEARKTAKPSSSQVPRSVPETVMRPDVARSKPAMTIRSVDLPEPLGPITATASPNDTSRSIPRRIATAPAREGNVTCTSSS